MAFLKRVLRALPLLLLSPFLVLFAACALMAVDMLAKLRGKPAMPPPSASDPPPQSASVVIPNWNGRDLLEKYLPSVVAAMAGHPGNEIIVVDNGSSDGSADFVRDAFPQVRLVALPENLGFGGGSNAGFRAARNRHRRAAQQRHAGGSPISWRRCSKASAIRKVFAVACQIFFSDPNKLREETGLTQAWWQDGALRVRHRDRPGDRGSLPVLLSGRRIERLRPRQIPRTGRLRRAAGAVLPGRHRPRLSGLEARLEGVLSAAQRGVPRASRDHRQAFPRRSDPGRAEEELTCCSAGKTSTSGRAWRRISSSPGRARCWRWFSAISRCGPTWRPTGALFASFRRRCARDAAPMRWPASPTPKLSDGRWAATSAIASTRWTPRRSGRACCSCRPIRSARRSTAAASSCTRRCASWPASPRRTWWSCWTGPGRSRTTWSCATFAPPPNGWCGRRAIRRGPDRCARARFASSPTRIWTG